MGKKARNRAKKVARNGIDDETDACQLSRTDSTEFGNPSEVDRLKDWPHEPTFYKFLSTQSGSDVTLASQISHTTSVSTILQVTDL